MLAIADASTPLRPHPKLIGAGLLAFAALEAASILQWLAGPQMPPFDDFFGLWSFGKFAAAAGPAIYNPAALQAFQHMLDIYDWEDPPGTVMFTVGMFYGQRSSLNWTPYPVEHMDFRSFAFSAPPQPRKA